MRPHHVTALLSFVTTAVIVPFCLAADDSPQRLSKADKELVLGLIDHPLVDPTGKQYCAVTIVPRSCWGSSAEVEVTGWYQAATEKSAARVFFTDGDWIPAPKAFKKRDFIAESQAVLAPPAPGKANDLPANDPFQMKEAMRHMDMVAAGSAAGVPELTRAAWLAKLGREDLAAKIIVTLKSDDSRWGDEPKDEPPDERIVRRLKTDLAWRAYADSVHAFMQRADEEALRHARRLHEKYPEFTTEFGDGKGLFVELERRKEAKTLGAAPPEKPADFERWDKPRQVSWLIEQLDQVGARQGGQPGRVHFARDWRVEALIEIGDPAVPGLIGTIEKDRRLTRSVHFWRDFHRSRTVLSVREAALAAVMQILKVRVFQPRATGDNFTRHGEDQAKATAESLRSYWKKYGQMPFEDRMMAILKDKESGQENMREAATNLSEIGDKRATGAGEPADPAAAKPREPAPNPVIKKFQDPTAAEAILAAMDRDLAQHDSLERGIRLWDYERRQIEGTYFDAVTLLGDKRISAELQRRCAAADTVRIRRQCALAAHVFGDSEPLTEFASDFKAGKLKLPANDQKSTNWNDQPGTVELAGIVRTLASVNTPAADEALASLADPKHPGYSIAARSLRDYTSHIDDEAWIAHPYCIKLLRRELDDVTPTKTFVMVSDQGQYVEENVGSTYFRDIPAVISDAASRRERAELRRCDVAAQKISELVIGVYPFHPLLKDADQRLDKMRKELDKVKGLLRPATTQELEKHDRQWEPAYVIDN